MIVLHFQQFGQPKKIQSILDWENDNEGDTDSDSDNDDTDSDAKVTNIDDLLVSDEDDEEPIADDFCQDFIGK
jgi:hypothetical protein